MNTTELYNQICVKKSFLCTGIDPEIAKLPNHLPKNIDSLRLFIKTILKETQDLSVAYKFNTAFFEQYGSQGWALLEDCIKEVPNTLFKIADAKRGDIGNTSSMYAKAFFEHMNFDAVTVSPYMGEDSLRPFLEFKNKWIIVLALTSNKGSQDFQHLQTGGLKLYEQVINSVCKWGNENQVMFVTGATQASEIQNIRTLIPNHFLLVPGVGAQGGSLAQVAQHGINSKVGLLINSSRGIIYAGNDSDFGVKAKESALFLQKQMEPWIDATMDH